MYHGFRQNIKNNYENNWYQLTDYIKGKAKCEGVQKKYRRKYQQQVRVDDGLYFDTKLKLMFKKSDKKDNNDQREICIGLLKEWGLSQYGEVFIDACGYNDMTHWRNLTKDDLMEVTFSEEDAEKFLMKLKQHTGAN